MSKSDIVHSIFRELFGYSADFRNHSHRIMIHNAVFLMQEGGISCDGDLFSFGWYKRGAYSQELQRVLIATPQSQVEQISFSKVGQYVLNCLKECIVTSHNGYSDVEWMELLGSLGYMRNRWYQTTKKEHVLRRLVELKPSFNKNELNSIGFDAIQRYNKQTDLSQRIIFMNED